MTGAATALELQNCTAHIDDVTMTVAGGNAVAAITGCRLSADRLRIHPTGASSAAFLIGGHDIQVRLTNSTMEETNVVTLLNDDGTGPGTSIELAYDTIYNYVGIDVCASTYPTGAVRRTIENTIIAASGTADALRNATSTACSVTSTILSHQATSIPGALVSDPMFVDVGAFDFRLKASSPAIDAATGGTITSDHDADGKPRPSGPAADIGAYEFQH